MSSKPFDIPKRLVWEAYQKVKANGGSDGIDCESLEEFDLKLKDNLYRIWNRLSSGSYIPPPVKCVGIPKKNGGERILGIPTVADRIAQTVVKLVLEPQLDPMFHGDSYGYRPNKSAHDAVATTRKRCWQYDWVVEFDIKGLFDNIDHELLMRALAFHCKTPWVLLYCQRWITADLMSVDGKGVRRTKGTPQGGVVSPLLANLFMHYTFDMWAERNLPEVKFCRYADDAVLHCKSEHEANRILGLLRARFAEVKLELNESKTKIVYCKDSNRQKQYANVHFDFLGFTFKPRCSRNSRGQNFTAFLPAVSNQAIGAMRQDIRRWKLQLKVDKSLEDLSRMWSARIRGWHQYYSKFYGSKMTVIWQHINMFLYRWVMHKFKKYRYKKTQASRYLRRIAAANRCLFPHWQLGVFT